MAKNVMRGLLSIGSQPAESSSQLDDRGSAIAKALLRAENRRLYQLCERLRISTSQPEQLLWAEVGRALASEQPEFNARKRGRPPKSFDDTIGIRRWKLIHEVAMNYQDAGGEEQYSIAALAEIMAEKWKGSEFKSTLNSITNSVSKARVELERNGQELARLRVLKDPASR